jgi:hypothetical protein
MTNEERIAEWLHDRDKGYWHSNKKWEWTKENEQAKNVWRKQARSLIVFLDSLGFVQKDAQADSPDKYNPKVTKWYRTIDWM